MKINKKIIKFVLMVFFFVIVLGTFKALAEPADGATIPVPKINVDITSPETPEQYVDNIKILILMTVLTLLPSIIIMTTSFTRIIIVLSLLKNAMGAQQAIPKQVLIGLALFLTFFIMSPTFTKVNDEAVQPYLNNEITQEEAIKIGEKPIKKFMLDQTLVKDIEMFVELGHYEDTVIRTVEDGITKVDYSGVPIQALIPAFMISELKTAFQIGFLLFLPFLIIDIVTGSVLMSMGMMMVPPVMVSLPFKILLFVLVDGWHLLVKSLILSFS
ncbi:flagellar type III secretion system pore protein FliP [Oceanirhabdus sp. W0125-5]|uniref:flagellar type III secretion system pore protein FliP n=1 Tax=Oceanirhabdus sp. W0125-5 TaxID=2999116 RepID=UPI0022F2E28F|nr:flagellar type III secretion system pore protein FliP [Oceanirhabdus sp. W0125-5]WBW95417.1 flagellar type III secretion system pore protein FliP [Oceanirhabdus sp. W0125-5]